MPNQRGNHPGFQFHPVGVGGTDDVSWLIQPERDRLAGTRRSTLTPEQVEMTPKHGAVAILPSSDLNASQAFYQRLGFVPTSTYESHGYRILHDSLGASIHLTRVDPGSVDDRSSPAATRTATSPCSATSRAILGA